MCAAPAAHRVFVHVGAPKTGTTYLQDLLWRHREALAGNGVLYPGNRRDVHFRAALNLRDVAFAGHRDPSLAGAWDRLAEQARAWQGGTAVLSHELLAAAKEEHALRAVASLEPAQVHVVYTARDLARQIPAMWQESVKNGQTLDFAGYLQRIERPGRRGRAAQIFWRSQDAPAVLERWSAAVPADRIHLITVPPAGAAPTLLWERFCSVVGIDVSRFDANVPRTNTSLGLAQVELVRRLNGALDDTLDWPDYEAVVKHELAERRLADRPPSPPASLPPRDYDWAVQHSRELVRALAHGPYDIVGSLDELVPPAEPPGPAGGGAVDAEIDSVLDVAVDVLAEDLIERVKARQASLRGHARRLRVPALAGRVARRLGGVLRR